MDYRVSAGLIKPTHSPKPTSPLSQSPDQPRMITVSPSCRNFRVSPPFRQMSLLPPQHPSSKLPWVPASVPLIVPEPSRSPTFMGHPEMLWCASICGNDHKRFLAFVRLIVVEFVEGAEKICVSILEIHRVDVGIRRRYSLFSKTSNLISYALSCLCSFK